MFVLQKSEEIATFLVEELTDVSKFSQVGFFPFITAGDDLANIKSVSKGDDPEPGTISRVTIYR